MPDSEDASRFTNRFIMVLMRGVLAILPVGLTLAALAWIVQLLHDAVGPTSGCGRLLRSIGMSVVACEVTAYILGVLGTVLLVYVVGLLVESSFGSRWQRPLDDALARIPVIGTLYDASKQVTSIFDRKRDALESMMPVLCYFSEDRAAATPALLPTAELVNLDGIEYHIVIVPTAPVPFGGALLCVRADRVKPAGCGFDELVSLYVSMGVSAPRSLGRSSRREAMAPAAPDQHPVE